MNNSELKDFYKQYKITPIAEIKPRTNYLNVCGQIIDIKEPKSSTTQQKYQRVVIADFSGSIDCTHWQNTVGAFEVGDIIIHCNCYSYTQESKMTIQSGSCGTVHKIASSWNMPYSVTPKMSNVIWKTDNLGAWTSTSAPKKRHENYRERNKD